MPHLTPAPVTGGDTFALIPARLLYSDATSTALRVYAVLAEHARGTGAAWPSRARLAALARTSLSTIERALRELVRLGAITVEARFTDTESDDGPRVRTSSRYVLHPGARAPRALHAVPEPEAPPVTGDAPPRHGWGDPPVTHDGTPPSWVTQEEEAVEGEAGEEEEAPQPPPGRGGPGRGRTERPAGHDGSHPRCRPCGTTPRQAAAVTARDRSAAERAAAAARHAAARETVGVPMPAHLRAALPRVFRSLP